jgi:hypothetical protein
VEERRIAYGPGRDNGLEPRLYSSLIIGRAHQLDFWQDVLRPEAFNTLSRQHFEVQTWRSQGSGVVFSFLVRNLSDVNPVHVRSGPQETADEPPTLLNHSEQRHLLDGDEIVLNIGQEHAFWLIFRDLTASTYVSHDLPLIGQRRSGGLPQNIDNTLIAMPPGTIRTSTVDHVRRLPTWLHKDGQGSGDISTTATPPGGGGYLADEDDGMS